MNDITLEFMHKTYKMGDKLSERIQNIMKHPSELPDYLLVGKNSMGNKGANQNLIVVCAESKTGKSVTLLNWAKFIAIDSGYLYYGLIQNKMIENRNAPTVMCITNTTR